MTTSGRKRRTQSIARTNVEWAWEFLRRNSTYGALYRLWNEATKAEGDLAPAGLRSELLKCLERTGPWKDRFRPWLLACFEIRRPFIEPVLSLKDEHGSWHESSISPINSRLHLLANRDDVLLTMQADRRLDPMNWMLSRWLDPDKALPATTEGLFSPAATLLPRLEQGSSEFEALKFLGLVALSDRSGSVLPTVDPTSLFFEDDGRTVPSLLSVEVDVTAPVEAQVLRLRELITDERRRIELFSDREVPHFFDPKRPDTGGSYSTCIRLLDELERCEKDADVEREPDAMAIRAVAGAPLASDHPIYKRLEQNLRVAKRLRDFGFRTLAFLPDSSENKKDMKRQASA